MPFLSDSVVENVATRTRIRQSADQYFNGLKYETSHSANFEKYTGASQDYLLRTWFGPDRIKGTDDDTKSRLTTCNAFVGKYAHSVIPSVKRKNMNLMGFYFGLECKKAGLEEAWFNQSEHPTLRPGYGDIVKFARHHVAVSLGGRGATWNRIESGQGGRTKGFDVIVFRENEPYSPALIEGWINLAILFDYDQLLAEQKKQQQMWKASPWEMMSRANREQGRSGAFRK